MKTSSPQQRDHAPALSSQQHFEQGAFHHNLLDSHLKEAARLRDAADHELAAVHANLAEEHLLKATMHVSHGIRGCPDVTKQDGPR